MFWIIGCGLVGLAFLVMRFVSPHQINSRFITLLWSLFLIVGLIFSFLSGLGFGFVTIGCFFWLYYPSFGERNEGRDIYARFYGVPIFANHIAESLGFILLLMGIILLFFKSLLYGLLSIVAIFVVVQVLEYLKRLESKLIEKDIKKTQEINTV